MATNADMDIAVKARKEVKRQVALAVKSGGTVPFSLRALIEAGVSAATIRKVYRAGNG